MKSASLHIMLSLTVLVCDRAAESTSEKTAVSPAADPRTDLLVGTWRLEGEREYTFSADGRFSMANDTSKCGGVAPTKSTASGTWQLNGDLLVLEVTQASEELFRGSTMQESIVKLEPPILALKTSVVGCSGQDIELGKE